MTGRPAVLVLGAAQLLMFGGMSLLQVAPGPFFAPLLLAMHAGILVFVRMKRRLSGNRPEVTRIGRATYLMMSLYLPILVYKLSDRLGWLQVHYPLLHSATLVLSALAVVVVIYSLYTIGKRAKG